VSLAGALVNWEPLSREFRPLLLAEGATLDVASTHIDTAHATTEPSWFTDRFESLRGGIEPPVAGVVLYGFGPRRGPAPNTTVRHPGITYRTTSEQTVRAIAQGRVEFAGEAEGYGLVVILNHGHNYHSVYAGLGQTMVSIDSVVPASTTVGSTEAGSRGTLYFEVRHFGEALNPSEWMTPQTVSASAL